MYVEVDTPRVLPTMYPIIVSRARKPRSPKTLRYGQKNAIVRLLHSYVSNYYIRRFASGRFRADVIAGDRIRRCSSWRLLRLAYLLSISPDVAGGRFATAVLAGDLSRRFGSGRRDVSIQL